jgi:hypothetical protein
MYTVAQILNPEFNRSWHEAVALVQEVALKLAAGATLPTPSEIHLDRNGAITFGFISHSGQPAVPGLANLLLAALNGIDAPPQVRQLATDYAGVSRHATVDAFTRALAFFERPDRGSALRALGERLTSGPTAAASAEAELQKLRERLSHSTPEKDETPNPAPVGQGSRRIIIATAVALGCIATGAVAFVSLRGGVTVASESPSAAPVSSVSPAHRPGAPATKVAGTGNRKSAAAARESDISASANRNAGPATSTRGHGGKGTRKDSAARRVVTLMNGKVSEVDTPEGAGDPVADQQDPAKTAVISLRRPGSSLSGVADARAGLEPHIIYSPADAEVVPPWLLRPQLPKEPAPGSGAGLFDIVVDEAGDVEEIRLKYSERSYQERMLVAAAKAWKFNPARLNGEPVKYRLRIPVDLPDPR